MLCYECCQPMTSNHNAKTCKQRLLCRICKECHLTGMYGYVKKASEEYTKYKDGTKDTVKCASVKEKLGIEVISMCVVPVWVGHRNSRKMVKEFSMLDNYSQGSFIKDDITEYLGILGRKLKLSLKTLTCQISEDTDAVDGLIISAVDCKKGRPMEWIELSKAYSRNCLPVERDEISTPGKIERLEYLRPISWVITQMDNIDVGMLIGANCMKALEPMEIISSRDGGPYAYRTKLGWCIVGPITTSRNDGSVKCHRVAMKDVASGKIAPHHFVLDDKAKTEDVGIKEMLERMYYSDFCECNHFQVKSILGNIEYISREDKKFLDILEIGTKKDGAHYEVPLPFRSI